LAELSSRTLMYVNSYGNVLQKINVKITAGNKSQIRKKTAYIYITVFNKLSLPLIVIRDFSLNFGV
jgi:hypothetical protein